MSIIMAEEKLNTSAVCLERFEKHYFSSGIMGDAAHGAVEYKE